MTRKEYKKSVAVDRARETKAARKAEYEAVISKARLETLGDVKAIIDGLSARSKERLLFNGVIQMAERGLSPKEIVAYLQIKDRSV